MVSMETKYAGIKVAISAVRGSGKTTLLLGLVKALRDKGLEVKGVIEAGIFEGDKKIAIEMIDLNTGESRLLAKLAGETKTDLQFGDWTFYRETFHWANNRIVQADTMDVFVLDEVGPLELKKKCGLQTGLEVMASNVFGLGIMTVRPKCLNALKDRFANIVVYSLKSWEKESLKKELLRIAMLAITL